MVEERRGEKGGQGGDSVIGELVGWGCGRGKKGRLICVIGVRTVEDLPEDRRQADLVLVRNIVEHRPGHMLIEALS